MSLGGVFSWLLMFAVLAAAVYAQHRLPFHTATSRQALFSRGLLGIVGLGVGWVAAGAAAPGEPLERMIAFLTGFGLVHVPAAFILYSKRLRGVSR